MGLVTVQDREKYTKKFTCCIFIQEMLGTMVVFISD